jgi:hypothetical protein
MKEIDYVKVTILKKEGSAVLVEYVKDGNVQRCSVPAREVNDGECSQKALDAGIPFGIPWESVLADLVRVDDFSQRLANNLRMLGVWEIDQATPQNVYSALQLTLNVDVHSIIVKAKAKGKGV